MRTVGTICVLIGSLIMTAAAVWPDRHADALEQINGLVGPAETPGTRLAWRPYHVGGIIATAGLIFITVGGRTSPSADGPLAD